MSNICLCLLLAVLTTTVRSFELGPGPSEAYDQLEILSEPNNFILYWKLVNNATNIVIEIHAKKHGWLVFGSRSEVVVAWVSNPDGTGHFSNRVLDSNLNLGPSTNKPWRVLDLRFKSSYLLLKMTRRVCDLNWDNVVIFGMGNQLHAEDIYGYKGLIKNFEIDLLYGYKPIEPCHHRTRILSDRISHDERLKSTYISSAELVNDFFYLHWNSSETKFIGELRVRKNITWYMFGFSSFDASQTKIQSDVVVAWIDAQQGTIFIDASINGNGSLIEDQSPNWSLLDFSENSEYLVYKFERNIISCDDSEDLTIETGTPNIIYSWGFEKVVSLKDLNPIYKKHQRTSQIVALSNTHIQRTNSIGQTIEFNIANVVLSNKNGKHSYFCKLFSISDELKEKRHIASWQLIQAQSHHNHHHRQHIRKVLVYECNADYSGEPIIHSGDCHDSIRKSKYCRATSIGWWFAGTGERKHHLPEDTGYPIGGDTDYKYILMEVYHETIDNHHNKPIAAYIESLTLRYFLYDSLQKNELGTFTLGAESDPIGIIIPPKQDSFKITSYCSNECIQNNLLADGAVTVVEALPLANSAGRQVSTKIIRDNTFATVLGHNRFFNDNFQQSYSIYPGINLIKNDSLITECVYSTHSRKRFTFGGLRVEDETCQQTFLYYPRRSTFKYCDSFVDVHFQYNLFHQIKPNSQINVTQRSHKWILNRLYNEYGAIMNMEHEPEHSFVRKLQNLYESSPYYSICQSTKMPKSSYVSAVDTKQPTTNRCKLLTESDLKTGDVESGASNSAVSRMSWNIVSVTAACLIFLFIYLSYIRSLRT